MVVGSVVYDTSSSVISPQKDVLESAARMVDQHIQLDNSHTELLDCLKMGGDLPSISGLNDHDYPGISELGVNFQPLSQLNLIKKTPLPVELIEQFRLMQGHCYMGLFPEIGRAWITIDSNIFLWSFHDGSDLAYFDGINESILCVGLAKPRPGVFQDFIHYLLCIATPHEIYLLGVSFSQQQNVSSSFEEMHLLPEPLFSFPTDNTLMSTFIGTENGRIFFGGQDGCLYEFTYQSGDGWFTRRCRKINHSSSALSFLVPSFLQNAFTETDGISQLSLDSSRNILYSMSIKGSIQVFDLGEDGSQMSRVAALHHQSISNMASAVAKTIDRKYFFPIVHVSAVEASESRDVNLVAVLQSGVRLYFTTNTEIGRCRPNTLALLHVRLPPGFSANTAMDRPSNVRSAYYRKGFSMLIADMFEDHDVLLTATNDSFIFHPHLIETHTGLRLDSHIWTLAEIPMSYDLRVKIFDPAGKKIEWPSTSPPLMITQHSEMPRQFLILSGQGCSIFTKPRPVDLLAKLLVEHRGPDSDVVKAFFKLHREAQACAMCLILCCSQNPQEKQVAEYATRAFFLYGGSPMLRQHQSAEQSINPMESQLSVTQPNPKPFVWTSTPAQPDQSFPSSFAQSSFPSVCSPMKSVYTSSQHSLAHNITTQASPSMQSPRFLSQPYSSPFKSGSSVQSPTSIPSQSMQSSQLSTSEISGPVVSEVVYSGKHDGLYFYFSRIMRPLWNLKLITEKVTASENTTIKFLCSNVSADDLSSFLLQLQSLKNFISQHLPRFVSPGNASYSTKYPSRFSSIQSRHSPYEPVSSHSSVPKKSQSEAELQERTSLSNLQKLVNYTYELLGLWKVLCDHQFEIVISYLSTENQDQLKRMMFKDFIIDGQELCTDLASAVIKFYLEDDTSTNIISQKLREVCPSIYRVEDATVSKVFEIVKQAKNIINKVDKAKELREALKLCKEVCPNFDLHAICNLFQEVQYYEGIVDICLCSAQRVDPQNLALHYYKNGEPLNDQQGMQALTNRINCYKAVVNIMNDLLCASTSKPQCPTDPVTPGVQNPRKPVALTPDEAKTYSEEIFEMCLRTDDELFHSTIYDWLFENSKIDTLLSISSHFLESYLKRSTSMHSTLQSLDLLWKFYEKNQNFGAAARVLSLLADKQDPNLQLSHRLEYLSRAIICIKSSEMRMATHGEGEFLHELEEKMEVARIQLQILETLQQKNVSGLHESLTTLNSNFLDITRLFEDFAVRYNLPESRLAIVHCAGHYDPTLIESLWQTIIDKELEGTCGQLPENRVKTLRQKLLSLSQIYMSSEKYFPVGFIIQYLEEKTASLHFEPGWVYQTMLSIGINIVDIWGIYHKFYRSKDTWLAAKKPLHLLQVLGLMIGEFVSAPSILPPTDRRMFVTLCLDAIAGYLVDLQAMSLADSMVSVLMKEFKTIQPILERLLL